MGKRLCLRSYGCSETVICIWNLVSPEQRYYLLTIQSLFGWDTPLHYATTLILNSAISAQQMQLLDIRDDQNRTTQDVALPTVRQPINFEPYQTVQINSG